MGDHDVDQALSPHLGEAGIIFHHRGCGDLSSQEPLFDDMGFDPASGGIDPGGQSGRTSSHDDQVGFNLLGIGFGDEDPLFLHLFQGVQEQLFRLRSHGDPFFIGESLGNALGAVLARQIGIGLDVDDLEGNQVGLFDGGLEAIDRLLRAVRTGRADKNFEGPGFPDLLQNFQRILAEPCIPGAHHLQGRHKGFPLFAHRRPEPADLKMFRIKKKGRRGGCVPFSSQGMVQPEFSQSDLGGDLPDEADHLSRPGIERFVDPRLREEEQGNLIGHVLE